MSVSGPTGGSSVQLVRCEPAAPTAPPQPVQPVQPLNLVQQNRLLDFSAFPGRLLSSSESFEESVDTANIVNIDRNDKSNAKWPSSHHCWLSKGPLLDEYSKLYPILRIKLRTVCEGSSADVDADLFMIGKDPQRAKPVIVVYSTDAQVRKRARKAIKSSVKHPFGLGDMRHPPTGRVLPAAMDGEDRSSAPSATSERDVLYAPSEGIKLVGMLVYFKVGQNTVRRATANVIYDGTSIALITAAHPHDEAIPADSSSEDGDDMDMPFDDESDSGDENLPYTSQLAITRSRNYGITATESSDTKEYRRLGTIYKVMRAVDCVLVVLGNDTAIKSLFEQKSAPRAMTIRLTYDMPNTAKVIAWTSRGPVYGTVHGAPSLMCFSKSDSFELAFKFIYREDDDIRVGDCGTWVTDIAGAELYGHIVAMSEHSRIAYVVSAEDLQRNLVMYGSWKILSPVSALEDTIPPLDLKVEALVSKPDRAPNEAKQIENESFSAVRTPQVPEPAAVSRSSTPVSLKIDIAPGILVTPSDTDLGVDVEAFSHTTEKQGVRNVRPTTSDRSHAGILSSRATGGLEPAGVAIGAISLLYPVFAACIEGYKLFSATMSMEPDYESVLLKMKIEEHSLLSWANLVGADQPDQGLAQTPMSQELVTDILEKQRQLLLTFGRLNGRYQSTFAKDLADEFAVHDDRSSAASTKGSEKKTSRLTQRFKDAHRKWRWMLLDKDKMEGIIATLAQYNNKLHETLRQGQMERLAAMQDQTSRKVDDLYHRPHESRITVYGNVYHGSSQPPLLPDSNDEGPDNLNEFTFRDRPSDALQEKRLLDRTMEQTEEKRTPGEVRPQTRSQSDTVALDTKDSSDPTRLSLQSRETGEPFLFNSRQLSYASISLRRSVDLLSPMPRSFASERDSNERTEAMLHGEPVWIEWREDSHSTAQSALVRFSHKLEKIEHDAPSCVPPFIGFFRDQEERWGMVFRNPGHFDPFHKPKTLYSLLQGSSGTFPSLTTRIQLMRCLCETLEGLHAGGHLHRGFRSTNVLFFRSAGTDKLDMREPHVSGFDDPFFPGPSDGLSELYRHPQVQANNADFNERHDRYALGIVLLEIAYWKPLERILMVNPQTASQRQMAQIRDWLLDEPDILSRARSYVGDTAEEVIRVCLTGLELSAGGDPNDHAARAKHLMVFHERVISRLQRIRGL